MSFAEKKYRTVKPVGNMHVALFAERCDVDRERAAPPAIVLI
jgi:hypothetical protein